MKKTLLALLLSASSALAISSNHQSFALRGTITDIELYNLTPDGLEIGDIFTGTFSYFVDPNEPLEDLHGGVFSDSFMNLKVDIEGKQFETGSASFNLTEHPFTFRGDNATDELARHYWWPHAGSDSWFNLVLSPGNSWVDFSGWGPVIPSDPLDSYNWYIRGDIQQLRPINGVPDAGSTLALLAFALAGLPFFKRRTLR